MMPTVFKIPLSSDGALGGRISKHKQLGSKQQSIDPPPSWASTSTRQRSNIKNWVVQPKGSCTSYVFYPRFHRRQSLPKTGAES